MTPCLHRDADTVVLLLDQLRATSRLDRLRAAAALSRLALRDRAAMTGLTSALKDPDPRVRRTAAISLGAVPDSAHAVPALVEALDDEDTGVRRQAITSLGLLGATARAALPALRYASQAQDPAIRLLAVAAVLQIQSGPSAVRAA